MANTFINSSFTLRPSTNDRDKPELTLRQTEVSRIPRDAGVTSDCMRGGRAFKRQRLFMDRSLSTTLCRGSRFDYDDDKYYGYSDRYISEDEYDNTITIHRRVSNEFPSRHRISGNSCVSESTYWKSRCLGMQNFCDDSQNRLREAEEDQRQLRQRVRELEEQLLLQTSGQSKENSDSDNIVVQGKKNGVDDVKCVKEIKCTDKEKSAPPTHVIEIKENHKAFSSCFYLTDGEGLNESYELDMEEDEDISMNAHFCHGILEDIDDDRNDTNINQRRG